MESYHLPVAHRATVGAHMPPEEVEFDDRGAFESFTYQLFTKQDGAPVGRAHDANKSLEGRWRHTSIMPTVFPSHMYVLAPDHLWYLVAAAGWPVTNADRIWRGDCARSS